MKARKINFTILLFILIGITTITAQANSGENTTQPDSKSVPLSLSFTFHSSHLWRGLDCSTSPYFSTDLSISDKNRLIQLGLWNGLGTNGSFKEISHYLCISNSGFTFKLNDVFNFSPGAKHNNKEYFNYKAKETGRFLDISLKYRLPGKLPLQLMWATLLFGRDRGPSNEYNRYSTYVEIEYPIYCGSPLRIDMGLGGAFALKKGKDEKGKITGAHFWGDHTGITNISLKASGNVSICNYTLPVSVYGMWNPEGNRANVQVNVTLFSW